jgi:hypothetical protein
MDGNNKTMSIIAALIAFIVFTALAFAGLNYANNLTLQTEGISVFFGLFIGVWILTMFR